MFDMDSWTHWRVSGKNPLQVKFNYEVLWPDQTVAETVQLLMEVVDCASLSITKPICRGGCSGKTKDLSTWSNGDNI